jgi:hypothetical protein
MGTNTPDSLERPNVLPPEMEVSLLKIAIEHRNDALKARDYWKGLYEKLLKDHDALKASIKEYQP